MEENETQAFLSSDRTWVECRSKRHIGRMYYFNKATGEAAWNLPESEIDKARKEAMKYGKQFQQLHSWPEPQDTPLDPPQIARVYNKQIINQYRQPFESGAYHQVMPSMPMGSMGLQQYGIPNQFDSNVWTIPPMHQIYITPPLVNQVIQPPNYTQNNLIESGLSHNNYPSDISARSPPPTANQGYQENNNCISNHGQNTMKQKVRKTQRFKAGQTDLRQVLAEKRKQRELAENHQIVPNRMQTTGNRGIVYHRNKSRSEIDSKDDYPQTDVDCDGDWLEENTHVCGTKLKLNLKNLRNLAKPDANTNVWYIVADRDIYLKHLNFLNIMLNSDKQCRLMMPREVYSLLQDIADSGQHRRLVNRARRAIALFKELLNAKMTFVGDYPDGYEDGHVLGCCQNLVDRNYHVILISNDTALHEHTTETSIPTFTIKDIKKYISDSTNDHESVSQLQIPGPITFTIDNSTNTKINSALKVDLGDQIDSQERSLEGPHMSVNSEMCGKGISDVGIQTDLGSRETSDLGTSLPSSQEHCDSSKVTQSDYIFHSQNNTNNENLSKCEQNSFPCIVNKRQIRLNRNTARLASKTNNNVEKRQFKWRARKCTTSRPSNASPSSNPKPNDTNKGTESPALLSENTEFKITDNAESSQASSISHHTIPSWNMVLEETSTSGVISNSSEVEFERPKQLNIHYQGSKLTENVIFEVSDETMAQYLKIKQDEWVSRFVQIMEEVLSQVLQKDPPFCDETMPPPWAIHEAAECIKLKFQSHYDIVQTAQRFIDIVDQISDNGRIKVDILPHQFMEMYSFGVHLVKIMQAVIDNCEDIATALDLLSRLLSDIRNPNTESSNHDGFGIMQESVMETTYVSHVSSNDTITRIMDLDIDDMMNSHLDIRDIQTPDACFGDAFLTAAACNSEGSGNALAKIPTSCENSIVAQIDSILSELPNQTKYDSIDNSSSKLDFTSNSPLGLDYHNFDSQSLLHSPQRQDKLSDSAEIQRIDSINSEQSQIDNESVKTTNNEKIKNDYIISESNTEAPKDDGSFMIMRNPVIEALKARKIDVLNPSPLSSNVMDEIFDYEEDCCIEDSNDTTNESVEGNIQNEPTVSDDDDERASRYCKLVQQLGKIVCDVILFCKSFKLDMKNEQILSQTQIKAKTCGLKLLDLWRASERILRPNSDEQAFPRIPNCNREVLLKCCDQAVVAIKWLNQINTQINNILHSN